MGMRATKSQGEVFFRSFVADDPFKGANGARSRQIPARTPSLSSPRGVLHPLDAIARNLQSVCMSIARTIQFRAPLNMNATADPSTLPSKFNGLAYTGAAVSGGVVIDLSTTTVPQSMALLEEHDRTAIIGKVESTTNRGGQLLVSGSLYSDIDGSKGQQIARLATRGFPFQMSVGVYDFNEQTIAAGQRLSVNGRDVAGPAVILKGGTVRECSVCTLGADASTSVRFFSANGPGRARALERLQADLGEVFDATERDVFMRMAPALFAFFEQKGREIAANAVARERHAVSLSAAHVYSKRTALAAGKTAPEARKSFDLSPASIYAARAAASRLH